MRTLGRQRYGHPGDDITTVAPTSVVRFAGVLHHQVRPAPQGPLGGRRGEERKEDRDGINIVGVLPAALHGHVRELSKGKFLMSHKSFLCVGLALVVVGSMLAGSASATAITSIVNASFTDPVQPDTFGLATTDAGWAGSGWTATAVGTTFISIYNEPEGSFTGADGDGIPAGTADGPNSFVSGHV